MAWDKTLIRISQKRVRAAVLKCISEAEKPITAVMVAKHVRIPEELAKDVLESLFYTKEIRRSRDSAMAGGSWFVYSHAPR